MKLDKTNPDTHKINKIKTAKNKNNTNISPY